MWRVPDHAVSIGVNEDDRLVGEIRLACVDSVSSRQPLDQTVERLDAIRDDPQHHVNGATRVPGVEGAGPELRRPPVPSTRRATKEGPFPIIRVLCEEHDKIEVPDASLATDVVVGASLGEGNEPLLRSPRPTFEIPVEERGDLVLRKALQPPKVIVGHGFVGARGIAPIHVVGESTHSTSNPASTRRTNRTTRCSLVQAK